MLVTVITDVHLRIYYGVLAELTYLLTERIALVCLLQVILKSWEKLDLFLFSLLK